MKRSDALPPPEAIYALSAAERLTLFTMIINLANEFAFAAWRRSYQRRRA